MLLGGSMLYMLTRGFGGGMDILGAICCLAPPNLSLGMGGKPGMGAPALIKGGGLALGLMPIK